MCVFLDKFYKGYSITNCIQTSKWIFVINIYDPRGMYLAKKKKKKLSLTVPLQFVIIKHAEQN